MYLRFGPVITNGAGGPQISIRATGHVQGLNSVVSLGQKLVLGLLNWMYFGTLGVISLSEHVEARLLVGRNLH